MPGSNVIEAQFDNAPADWEQKLHALSGVTSVQHEGAGMYRILTGDGSRATTELVETAGAQAGVVVKSLSVQNTTLDDVFVHYTGRQLRDELVKAHSFDAAQTRNAAMNRMLAIVEREMRKFFRSPALMFVSMIFPLVQLIVLGNAFGGKIRDARLGLVDQDGGTQALRIREAFDSVRANMRTFEPIYYSDPKKAMEDVRNGKIEGAVIIPPQYSPQGVRA